MGTFFITGGYGFLGQYIVKALHDHDPQAELRVQVRTRRKTHLNLEALPHVQWLHADLTDPASYAEALQGVDTVVHCAAMVSFNPAKRQEIFDSNVIATRSLAQLARAAGCRNFIFISSISAVDFRPPKMTEESFLPDLERKKKDDIYGYTKRLSEIELVEMKDDLRVIILNPSVILGPGSERVAAAIALVRKFPLIPMMDYINAFVDVRDVAAAVVLAVTRGLSGERYLVSAHNESMLAFTRLIVKALGRSTRVLPLPPGGVRALDGVVALLDLLHLNPGIRRPAQMNIDKPCSHAKISAGMGWEPAYSLERSVADSVAAAVKR